LRRYWLEDGISACIADRLSMMRVHADGVNGGGKQNRYAVEL